MSIKQFLLPILLFISLSKVNAQNSAIGNYVWYDSNRNGIQDSTELGIGNVLVKLTKPSGEIESILTDGSGKYVFNNLIAGIYSVEFITPLGMLASTPNVTNDSLDSDPISGFVTNINLLDNTIDSTIDAGFANACTGTIKGNIWHDINGMDDGIIDSIGSYTVYNIPIGLRVIAVSLSTGKVVKVGVVAGNTNFILSNIPPGDYYLILSNRVAIVGQFPPNSILFNNWLYTGEKVGTGPGRDLLTNGKLYVKVEYECVYVKFGIQYNNLNWTGGMQ